MRRQFIASILLVTASPWLLAQESSWPSKPIRIVVGFPAGTPPDLFARLYGERFGKSLGVPVVVENKPGAGGNIASDTVAKAPGDGYTLLYTVSNAIVMNRHLYAKLGFDPDKDLTPVAPTLQQGLVVVVNNSVPARNVSELVALAKAGPMNYGSYGPGGFPHLIIESMLDAAKVKMTHVPYRQGVMNDVMGGQLQVLAEPIATAMGFINSQKVRAIAYTGPARHPSLPDLPTISETYPGVAAVGWHGFWAPGNTPPEIVRKLNALVVETTKSAEVSKRIFDLHCQSRVSSPAEMASVIASDSAAWGKVIRDKGIKLD